MFEPADGRASGGVRRRPLRWYQHEADDTMFAGISGGTGPGGSGAIATGRRRRDRYGEFQARNARATPPWM